MAKKNGLIQEKNAAGQVIMETEWLDGKRHGRETTYDSQGNIVKQIQYEYGEKLFVDEYYQGKISKHTPYLNGKKDGALIEYNKGKKLSEVNYSNGKKHGISIKFDARTGKPLEECRFECGTQDKNYYKKYDESGKLLSERDGDIEREYICDNDLPSFGRIYEDNFRIKAVVKYFKNGNIGVYQSYDGDRKFIYYDLEGNKVSKSEFVAKYMGELNYPKGYIEAEVKEVDHYDLDDDEGCEEVEEDEGEFVFSDEDDEFFKKYASALDTFVEIAQKVDEQKLINDENFQKKFGDALANFKMQQDAYKEKFKALNAEDENA